MAYNVASVEELLLKVVPMARIFRELFEESDKLKGSELRRLAHRMRAVAEFSRLVGAFDYDNPMPVQEEDAAWERWHVRFRRRLKPTGR